MHILYILVDVYANGQILFTALESNWLDHVDLHGSCGTMAPPSAKKASCPDSFDLFQYMHLEPGLASLFRRYLSLPFSYEEKYHMTNRSSGDLELVIDFFVVTAP